MNGMCLEIAGTTVRLEGLSALQEATINSIWPELIVSATPPEAVRVEVRRTSPASFRKVDTRGRPYELELDYGKTHTELTGMDLHGRLEWTRELAGTLSTSREEPQFFRTVVENFLRVTVAHALVLKGGFLAHGAVVFADTDALLFVGRSGAGKSTVSRMALASGRRIASDDLNPVSPAAGEPRTFEAGGSPFIGDVGGSAERAQRLRGIYRLEKARVDSVRPIGVAETLASLLGCAPFVNRSPHLGERLIANIEAVASTVPSFALSFRRDGSFWPLVEVA